MAAPINSINSSFYPRIEPIAINRTELIAANNRQIAALENQIITQKEVTSNIRNTINITKELINNNKESIAVS